MRSMPRARTSTFLTESGKRNSAGRRMACVRFGEDGGQLMKLNSDSFCTDAYDCSAAE